MPSIVAAVTALLPGGKVGWCNQLAAADLGGLGPAHRREGAALLRATANAGEPRARLLAGTLLAAFPSAERQSGLDAVDRLASTTDLAPRIAAAARRARRRLDRLTA